MHTSTKPALAVANCVTSHSAQLGAQIATLREAGGVRRGRSMGGSTPAQ